MDKKRVLWILLDLVFVVVFNILFFMFGGADRPPVDWVPYVFILLSYIMVVVTPYMIRKSSQAVLGLSIYAVSSAYFMAEFVIGLIFLFMKNEDIKISIAVQVILLGVYLVILISNLLANEHTVDQMETQQAEVKNMKEMASAVKALEGRMSDKKADKAIEHIYDMLYASPTKSDPSVYGIESEIEQSIDELKFFVDKDDTENVLATVSTLVDVIDNRNRKLKIIG